MILFFYFVSCPLKKQQLKTKIYGFDSFEGLKEDMVGDSCGKGGMDLKGKIPDLNKNVI